MDTVGEEEGGMNWERSTETYSLLYVKLDSQWEFAVWCKELNPVLCDSLEGWDGVGGGRGAQEGGDICIAVADSFWCTAEISTIL